MLTELRIANFAIIAEESVSFGPGLNVISGETGAGKSIILEALKLILGGRGSADLVRDGATELEVQALLDLSTASQSLKESLPELAVGDGNTELLLSRRMAANGKGKVSINGKLGSVGVLQEIAQKLISICGQNQSLRLFEPSYHLILIDQFAGDEALLLRYRDRYLVWRNLDKQLTDFERRLAENVLRRAELEHIVNELQSLDLKAGLRAELEAEVRGQANTEKILALGSEVSAALNQEDGVFQHLKVISKTLRGMTQLGGSLNELFSDFEAAQRQILEFDADFSDYLQSLTVDEERLNELRERLAKIAALERRYKTNEEGLLALLNQATRELALFSDQGKVEKLRVETAQARQEAQELAQQLSTARKNAADSLTKKVRNELSELNMREAVLEPMISPCELCEDGAERIELMISTNRGEPLRALRQIASGGELSRIMLVLKKVLRDRSGVHVLIFDEVDSGISGSVARAVGEKLKALSNNSQVICITHLPQVASLADRHLLVEKMQGKRAVTRVRELSKEERVEEVARMLAGHKITAATKESARELLASNRTTSRV